MSSKHDEKQTVVPQIMIGQYILKETLGCGTFGTVKIGVHSERGTKVAVKIMHNRQKMNNQDVVDKIRRETENVSKFNHPHLIKIHEFISTPTDIVMIMEYVSGVSGDLADYIMKHGRLEEKEARKFFQQIISGVYYCHRHMVVHRDLKPENLLLDDKNNVKITDFGIMTDCEYLPTSEDSPNYRAPEIISGKLSTGPEVDVWACGFILYALLCASLPFDDDHTPTLFRKIKSGIFPIPDYLDKSVAQLLRLMLQVDPMKRAVLKDVIAHDWFKKDCPAYLFPPEPQEASIVDIDAILQKVTSEILRRDPASKLIQCYDAIVDQKRLANGGAKFFVNF